MCVLSSTLLYNRNMIVTVEQLEYLEMAGQNAGSPDIALTDPEGVQELREGIADGRLKLVGSNVLGIECDISVVNILDQFPTRFAGNLIVGNETRIHPQTTIIGSYLNQVDVRGSGQIKNAELEGPFIQVDTVDHKNSVSFSHHGAIVQINRRLNEVTVNSHSLELTNTEYRLLNLMAGTGITEITKRLELLKVVGSNFDTGVVLGDLHTVDVHVSNLRSKLRRHGAAGIIKSIRGVGFLLKPVNE